MDLNKLAQEVFEVNKTKGFHDDEISNETLLMLIITELSEAVEADRKNKHANIKCFEDRPSHDTFSFESNIKDTVEDELADVIIRALDLAGLRGTNVDPTEIDEEEVTNFKFSEYMFYICYNITEEHIHGKSIEDVVNNIIGDVIFVSNKFNIDIWKYVLLKIEYNKTRSHRHGGKSY